jgi:hypothetical protein
LKFGLALQKRQGEGVAQYFPQAVGVLQIRLVPEVGFSQGELAPQVGKKLQNEQERFSQGWACLGAALL